MWFETLMGFEEESPGQVRENISVEGDMMTSRVNGKRYICGVLETPSLGDLRERTRSMKQPEGQLRLREVVGDVQSLHRDVSNTGAMFQVASQFNLLEMVSPNVTPEEGVGIYEHDHTQGPSCAIAAGAGTIFRNYFAPVNGGTGQSAENQINCLADLGRALNNNGTRLWEMKNGYALATEEGLSEIDERLKASGPDEVDDLRKLLRIGMQWNTQVTVGGCSHTVSQAYCSALPVAYSHCEKELWARFARLVLEASYEATICGGIINANNTGNSTLYLTLLGGGVFGNDEGWILDAMERALSLYRHAAMDVAVVSYGSSNLAVQEMVRKFR
ncbi:MAG TPA: hypothetical protein PK200_10140 [Spirochaetota bacterium]|nr:hypothetical protein [Spirochaetota bacterium]